MFFASVWRHTMSTDFICIGILVKDSEEIDLEYFAVKSVIPCLVGPDEDDIWDFEREGELDVKHLKLTSRKYLNGKLGPNVSYFEGPYVNRSLTDIENRFAIVHEPFPIFFLSLGKAPLLSVYDRILAIPRGVTLMKGIPYQRILSYEVANIAKNWSELIVSCKDELGALKVIRPYLDGYSENPIEDIKKIANLFKVACDSKVGILLFSCLP